MMQSRFVIGILVAGICLAQRPSDPKLMEPQKAPEKYRKFFALGVDVGNGVNKWK